MDIEQAKQYAKKLKKQFADDLEYHRNTGNYKFEITPGDIYNAAIYGYELAIKEEQTPLTNEIIKKNGFTVRKQNEMGYVHYEIEEPEYVEIKNYNGLFELIIWNHSDIVFEKDVKYVEDVQKALDICDVSLRFKAYEK